MSRIWPILGFVAAGALSAACGPTCKRNPDDPPVVYDQGTTSPSGMHYMTGAFDERFLFFPGGRTYRLEHDLRQVPTRLTTYLSFSEEPIAEGGGGFSESAGNQAVVEDVTDEFILIRNDTCAEFWLRVEATTGDYDAPASPADGGAN